VSEVFREHVEDQYGDKIVVYVDSDTVFVDIDNSASTTQMAYELQDVDRLIDTLTRARTALALSVQQPVE
jgi:hypothetical protein